MQSQRTNDVRELNIVASIGERKILTFTGANWRKAINYYLNTVWSQSNFPTGADRTLIIGNVMLDLKDCEFTATFESLEGPPPSFNFDRREILAVSNKRDSMELGLAKFVRNNETKMLVVEGHTFRVLLWKGRQRTELYAAGTSRTFW